MKSGIEAPPKRYRYTGMERDEESGLSYHSARFAVPWLGRWCSTDPAGLSDGPNIYQYCGSAPVNKRDMTGKKGEQDRYESLGLRPGFKYGFSDKSEISVGKGTVEFRDEKNKVFLSLNYETVASILEKTNQKLQGSHRQAASSVEFREKLIERYYEKFSTGNPASKNAVGSGHFKYEQTEQHLSDSIWNAAHHGAEKKGYEALASITDALRQKNKGMECYGTTWLDVLKARGLLPPDLSRAEFESQYTSIGGQPTKSDLTKDLPALTGGGASADQTRQTFQKLVDRFSKEEWAKFAGVADKQVKVDVLKNEKEVAEALKKGEVVFVAVKSAAGGHYKTAVHKSEEEIVYGDPLKYFGGLYKDAKILWGVVVR
jgi:RHS repeat-associated protein